MGCEDTAMIHLPGSRNIEAPLRRYAIHDGRQRQIVPVRVVERPLEVGRGARRPSTLWGSSARRSAISDPGAQ
jgi:hypothetical protein